MILYHWTSLENAKQIDKEGLKHGTWCIYLCRKPDTWARCGKVCYEVNVARHLGYKLSMPFIDSEILCWNDILLDRIKRIEDRG